MPHKKLFLSLLTLFFLQITVAQKLNAIDQKGTKIEIINNKVTTAATAPSNPNSNDVWYDTSTTPTTVKIYNGTAWLIMEHKGTTGSVFFAATNGLPTEDNGQLFWDNSAKSLKVGATGNIDTKLTVNGKVLSNTALELKGTLIDGASSPGTSGQVLSSKGTTTAWIDPKLVDVLPLTASYTLTLADSGKVITMNNDGPTVITVPSTLPVGYNVSIYQLGAGTVTITGASGVNVVNRLSRFKTAGPNAGVGLVGTAAAVAGGNATTFHLTGDLKK